MQTKTKKRIVQIIGLLLTPVITFMLLAGAEAFDGSIVGAALIVAVPLALYAAGFHLVLKGFSKQISEQNPDPA